VAPSLAHSLARLNVGCERVRCARCGAYGHSSVLTVGLRSFVAVDEKRTHLERPPQESSRRRERSGEDLSVLVAEAAEEGVGRRRERGEERGRGDQRVR